MLGSFLWSQYEYLFFECETAIKICTIFDNHEYYYFNLIFFIEKDRCFNYSELSKNEKQFIERQKSYEFKNYG